MYPYTHMAVGAAVGGSLPGRAQTVRGLVTFQCIGALGGLIADLPMLAQVLVNIRRGVGLLDNPSPFVQISTELSHSIVLWTVAYVIWAWKFEPRHIQLRPRRHWAIAAFWFGNMLHLITDALSHGHGAAFKGNGYLWPIPFNLGAHLGFFDYRAKPLTFWPQMPELAVFWIMVLVCFRQYSKLTERVEYVVHKGDRTTTVARA